jgi:hypothetical protein
MTNTPPPTAADLYLLSDYHAEMAFIMAGTAEEARHRLRCGWLRLRALRLELAAWDAEEGTDGPEG